jgi:ribokinase
MDMVVRTQRAPVQGETLFGQSFALSPGGKGANQAVAAARLGGDITMIGSVGMDSFGREMLDIMRDENINTQYISQSGEHPTGVASIVIEEDGENRIIVVPGANISLTAEDILLLESVISGAELVVMQLEMDLGMTEQAVAIARSHRIPVILNPAPARTLSDELLRHVTYLTPNETEAGILTGITVDSVDSAEQAARQLLLKGVKHVLITMGSQGVLIVTNEGSVHVPGYPVRAVDTVAAGDSFNGALAVQLTRGKTLTEAAAFANAVGALTVGKQGAVPSLPYLDEVENLLKSIKGAGIFEQHNNG